VTSNNDVTLAGKIEHSAPTGFPEHERSGANGAPDHVEEAQATTTTTSENPLEEKDKEAVDKFQEKAGTAVENGNFDAAKVGSAREAKRTHPAIIP
jgi:hypothetical protein